MCLRPIRPANRPAAQPSIYRRQARWPELVCWLTAAALAGCKPDVLVRLPIDVSQLALVARRVSEGRWTTKSRLQIGMPGDSGRRFPSLTRRATKMARTLSCLTFGDSQTSTSGLQPDSDVAARISTGEQASALCNHLREGRDDCRFPDRPFPTALQSGCKPDVLSSPGSGPAPFSPGR